MSQSPQQHQKYTHLFAFWPRLDYIKRLRQSWSAFAKESSLFISFDSWDRANICSGKGVSSQSFYLSHKAWIFFQQGICKPAIFNCEGVTCLLRDNTVIFYFALKLCNIVVQQKRTSLHVSWAEQGPANCGTHRFCDLSCNMSQTKNSLPLPPPHTHISTVCVCR